MISIILGIFDDFEREMSTSSKTAPLIWPGFLRAAFIRRHLKRLRELSAGDMRRCHVSLNNAIRKIFSFAVWDSIRHLRLSRGYKCVYELFASAKAKFLANARVSTNTVVRLLSFIDVVH